MADYDPNQFDINKFIYPFDIESQKKEGQQYLGDLTSYLQSQETLPAMYSRLSGQYGVPQLQEQALRLGELGEDISSQIFATPDIIKGTTRESLVTEPQRAAMVQKMQEPLREDLLRITGAGEKVGARLAAAQGEVGRQMQYGMAEQEKMLLPFEMGFDLLQQRQAREFSGYTFEMEQELNRLIANQQAGVQLSEGERNRMNQLAIAEAGYRNSLDQIRLQQELGHTSYTGYGDYDMWSGW